jgi:hypothetical protein
MAVLFPLKQQNTPANEVLIKSVKNKTIFLIPKAMMDRMTTRLKAKELKTMRKRFFFDSSIFAIEGFNFEKLVLNLKT